jgi:hypothetical protein
MMCVMIVWDEGEGGVYMKCGCVEYNYYCIYLAYSWSVGRLRLL